MNISLTVQYNDLHVIFSCRCTIDPHYKDPRCKWRPFINLPTEYLVYFSDHVNSNGKIKGEKVAKIESILTNMKTNVSKHRL